MYIWRAVAAVVAVGGIMCGVLLQQRWSSVCIPTKRSDIELMNVDGMNIDGMVCHTMDGLKMVLGSRDVTKDIKLYPLRSRVVSFFVSRMTSSSRASASSSSSFLA